MSVETTPSRRVKDHDWGAEPILEPPTCPYGHTELAFVDGGTERRVPLVGEGIDYQRFSCPNCGLAARDERESSDERWSRAGV